MTLAELQSWLRVGQCELRVTTPRGGDDWVAMWAARDAARTGIGYGETIEEAIRAAKTAYERLP